MSSLPDYSQKFNQLPREARDDYTAQRYEALGLGVSPTFDDIEPYALDMIRRKRVIEAMCIVLGRFVGDDEVVRSEDLYYAYCLAYKGADLTYAELVVQRVQEDLDEL